MKSPSLARRERRAALADLLILTLLVGISKRSLIEMRCTAVGACWVELGPLGAGAGVRAGAGSRFPRRSALGGAPMGRGGRHLMPVRQGAGSLWRIPAARGAPEETDPSAQHTTDRSHKARPLTRASLAGRSNGARAHARPGAGCTSRTHGLRVGAVRGRARRFAVAPAASWGRLGCAPPRALVGRCVQGAPPLRSSPKRKRARYGLRIKFSTKNGSNGA
jgi:hypothetical protein